MNHNPRNTHPAFIAILSILLLYALAGCSILPGADAHLAPTPTSRATAGGRVLSPDGSVRLEIPPGALSADAAIRLDSLEVDELPAAWSFASGYLGAGRFDPHGLQFVQPVTATFNLSHPQPSGKALELFYYLDAEERYVYLGPRAIVDSDGNTASAQIDHFSMYVVAEPPPGGYPVIVVVRVTLDGAPVTATGRQVWVSLRRGMSVLAKAPDEFLLAYTGIGSVARPGGFPAPDPDATPLLVVAQPQPESSPSELMVAGYARVNQSSGQRVVVRQAVRLDSPVTASFPDGERLLILEGAVENEEGVWWKVHGRQGEGWCLAEWLEPSE